MNRARPTVAPTGWVALPPPRSIQADAPPPARRSARDPSSPATSPHRDGHRGSPADGAPSMDVAHFLRASPRTFPRTTNLRSGHSASGPGGAPSGRYGARGRPRPRAACVPVGRRRGTLPERPQQEPRPVRTKEPPKRRPAIMGDGGTSTCGTGDGGAQRDRRVDQGVHGGRP